MFLFALLAAGAIAYLVFASRAKKAPQADPVIAGFQRSDSDRPLSARMLGYRLTGPNGPVEGEVTLPCVVGRGSSADLVVDDDEVSREHARISADGDGFKVEDLGSRNGLFSGEQRVDSVRMRPGEEFRIGRTTITLR